MNEIDRDGPQREHSECLVGPAEPLPDSIESIGVLHLPHKESDSSREHRNSDQQTLVHTFLTEVKSIGNDQTSRAERRITTRIGAATTPKIAKIPPKKPSHPVQTFSTTLGAVKY